MCDATVWVVYNRVGHPIASTVREKRVSAIKAMVGPEDGWQKRWRWWKRQGCLAIRVRIVPEAGLGGGGG